MCFIFSRRGTLVPGWEENSSSMFHPPELRIETGCTLAIFFSLTPGVKLGNMVFSKIHLELAHMG